MDKDKIQCATAQRGTYGQHVKDCPFAPPFEGRHDNPQRRTCGMDHDSKAWMAKQETPQHRAAHDPGDAAIHAEEDIGAPADGETEPATQHAADENQQ